MKYGFVIDNRKCIGCHACTTACKSEHQVPVGVNRTWVKQVEKGEFPNTRRLFSVMRCNHCTDAPCVDICPTEALYFRDDGIVDFDKDRCIGCKSCMQACPYDALYIDPETHTAAKCNYCAHRVDVGLEPACVNVCPEHAIISGDMEDANSEITQLLSQQAVKVRKPEKGTVPNLFYIDADDASLNPTATEKSDGYFWSSQSMGVGHFAKEAEKMAFSNGDLVDALMKNQASETAGQIANNGPTKSVDVLMGNKNVGKAGKAVRTYDVADKGILWGWEVSAYVWTKAIAAGMIIVPIIGNFMPNPLSVGIALFFLLVTGLLLIKDLDRPDRFLNVLFRPQWKSWLVKGGYGITFFGLFTSLLLGGIFFGNGAPFFSILQLLIFITTWFLAAFVAIYTAFLFAQAKGRDFWQSPMLSIHMLLHSVLAGAAVYSLILFFQNSFNNTHWNYSISSSMSSILFIGLLLNLFSMLIELATPHATDDAKRTVNMITKGMYKKQFWGVVILLGNVIPLVLLFISTQLSILVAASVLVLIGIYFTNKIWVEAPQRIPLS